MRDKEENYNLINTVQKQLKNVFITYKFTRKPLLYHTISCALQSCGIAHKKIFIFQIMQPQPIFFNVVKLFFNDSSRVPDNSHDMYIN